MLSVEEHIKCPIGNSQQGPAGDSSDMMWGMDLRGALFASHTRACPVREGGEREHSFIHLFNMCLFYALLCWELGHDDEGETSAVMKPTGKFQNSEILEFDY